MESKARCSLLALLLLGIVACAEAIVPADLCRLYVGGRVFNLTGVGNHEELALQQGGSRKPFAVVSSLCRSLSLEDLKAKFPALKDKLQYAPPPQGQAAVVLVPTDAAAPSAKAVNLAVFSPGSRQWKAALEERSKDQAAKSASALEITYQVADEGAASQLGISKVVFRFVCFQEDDFDFFDERVVGSTLVLQYDGGKACSINQPKLIDSKWNLAILVLVCTSIYGIFLDREHERIVMTLGSVQGAFMTVIAIYIALGYVNGPTTREKDTFMQLFGAGFIFLAVGLSYFSRYVSMFFVCIASSFAVNCTLLYAFCLIFGLYIPTFLFYIGGLTSAGALLGLLWFSTPFREKYSFTLVSATTNAFYLCGSLAYITDWVVNMFNFNEFKAFGKVDRIQFKHWVFFLLQLAITAGVASFRMRQAKKTRDEAIAKNASLFKKEGTSGDVEGYFQPDRGDDDPLTIIAM